MERTHKILKVVIADKASCIKGLREYVFQSGGLISSQGRYDRFDTSPYSIFIPGGFDSGAVKAK
jgi:hypothetical protein